LIVVFDGVPKNGNAKDAQKMLAKWGIAAVDVAKVKKIHRKSNMQVTAVSEEALERLLKLEGIDNGKGKKLRVMRKEVAKRELGDDEEVADGDGAAKRAKPDGFDGDGKELAGAVRDNKIRALFFLLNKKTRWFMMCGML
jgi:hypothetical protein